MYVCGRRILPSARSCMRIIALPFVRQRGDSCKHTTGGTPPCAMLPERYLACYPNHVELAGTSPGCVMLGLTGTLTWDLRARSAVWSPAGSSTEMTQQR